MAQELKKKDMFLEEVNNELKKTFIGIDNIIDQFITAVRVWYLMPELMIRPFIVNLWGLTGTGKTSLVREFVKLIKMSDAFIEIQMNNSSNKQTIQERINRTNIDQHSPSILLLDEMQRFRTITSNGEELQDNTEFSDVWMLLSDGKFQSSSSNKDDILSLLYSDAYNRQWDEKDDKKKMEKIKYKMYRESARDIKKLLKLREPAEEIMTWNDQKKTELLRNALKDDEICEGVSYPKMLIIISGNIDDAYTMADDVSDADTDADVFHDFSKKINVVNIKNALAKRFKPEQIARFGNNHIIYPSLSKKNYEDIIRANIGRFIKKINDIHGISIDVDETVYTTIYENGVFPSQGVRPVISTISGIFENYIPIFLLKSMEENIKKINVKFVGSNIVGEIGDHIITIPVELTINNIKKNKNMNEKIMTSVHEAGHAIVYATLYKVTPTQIKSSTASETVGGFVGVHMMNLSKTYARDVIAVSLAGQAAEEIVFGEEYKSAGAASDISYATRIAAEYVRKYGFDGIQSRLVSTASSGSESFNTDVEKTNTTIENMLVEGKKRAIDMINVNKQFFKDVVQKLIDSGYILPVEFKNIAVNHGIELINCSSEVKLIHNYNEKWGQYSVK